MGGFAYVKVSDLPSWVRDSYPSAGPNPNITGMRKLWGQDSYIIKSGAYIYKVPYDTFWSLTHS